MISTSNPKCNGCGACSLICAKNAISMQANDEGFLYPVVNKELCVNCSLCEKICPVLKDYKKDYTEKDAFAVIYNDEKVRAESSSGGVFTALAKTFIEENAQNAVVFGAAFDKDFSVKHTFATTIEEIEQFRGSKYLQSRIENTFVECKKFLEEGKKVLFTGTPCQIGGLKAFLQKDYENLYTVDIICHGVPSPALWKNYVKYREKKSASRTVKTAFRRKNDGWKLFSLSFTFVNESEYREIQTKDKYMQLFLKDNGLRESCYQCSFRGDNHKSDLTIADFWGVENVNPAMFDDKGTSLVIVQNQKGKEIFDKIVSNCKIEKTDFNKAVSFNPSYFTSKKRSKKRNTFYKNFEKHDIDYLYKKYARHPAERTCALFWQVLHVVKIALLKR